MSRYSSLPDRQKPMKRGGRLKNRGGKRFKGLEDPSYREHVRGLPCVVNVGCLGVIQACHFKSRGAGGQDRENLFPGCLGHHTEQHSMGIKSFQRKYNIDLDAITKEIDSNYEQTDGDPFYTESA